MSQQREQRQPKDREIVGFKLFEKHPVSGDLAEDLAVRRAIKRTASRENVTGLA